MASRKRDHKAEYARRKQLAKARGYKGVREYKRTRKSLGLSRRDKTPPRSTARLRLATRAREATSTVTRLRRECKEWSDTHSHVTRSKYHPAMTDDEVKDFHRAYVEYNPDGLSRRKAARDKRRRIGRYVLKWHDMSEDEWAQKYELQQG